MTPEIDITLHEYGNGHHRCTRVCIRVGHVRRFLSIPDFKRRYGKDEAAMKRLGELTGGHDGQR